jgi:hypothetical protein
MEFVSEVLIAPTVCRNTRHKFCPELCVNLVAQVRKQFRHILRFNFVNWVWWRQRSPGLVPGTPLACFLPVTSNYCFLLSLLESKFLCKSYLLCCVRASLFPKVSVIRVDPLIPAGLRYFQLFFEVLGFTHRLNAKVNTTQKNSDQRNNLTPPPLTILWSYCSYHFKYWTERHVDTATDVDVSVGLLKHPCSSS